MIDDRAPVAVDVDALDRKDGRHRGLSQISNVVLRGISRNEAGPLTATQLAQLTSSDAFKVARSIELLVRRGLIYRDVDKADRRRASLSLTADGRKVYKDIEKFVVRVERKLMAALDPHEVEVLRRSLDKLDRQLETEIKAQGRDNFL
ncbi:winged helix DNA-binding protein [Bradyrhizobium sp. B117]|uniref:MarR family winged helix-turn-helix transcriptional regulator n=1 Tax=Bradyrhizobium sp. B117 TaxID=3140246 RepID=UPI003182CF7D